MAVIMSLSRFHLNVCLCVCFQFFLSREGMQASGNVSSVPLQWELYADHTETQITTRTGPTAYMQPKSALINLQKQKRTHMCYSNI